MKAYTFCHQNKEKKNLESALLIEPNNEEVILMLMNIARPQIKT